MLRKMLVTLSMLLLVASGLVAGPAGAATQPQGPEQPLASVTLLPTARLTADGEALVAKVRLLCQPNGTGDIQWEGFIHATQGEVFAWAEVPLVCDGRRHITDVTLPVSAPPGTAWFTTGEATVTVSLLDENTLTQHATDTRTVKVR